MVYQAYNKLPQNRHDYENTIFLAYIPILSFVYVVLPYTIAGARGFAYAPTFDNDARLHKEVVSSFATAARMLAAGRVDLTLEDEWVARYYLSHELAELSPALEFLPVPLSESPLHILVRRKHPQSEKIVSAFNQALRDMRADGSYTAILQRHGLQ